MAKRDRIEIFCNAVIEGKSNRQAYYEAYPNSRKWKAEAVDSRAYEFSKDSAVLDRLEDMRSKYREKAEITQEKVIEQLTKIGFADIDVRNIKPADKIKALEAITKILGLDSKKDNEDTGILIELVKYLKGDE